MQFKLTSEFQPTGDQPEAIRQLIQGLQSGRSSQVLLGVTGSGKTFTVANVINEIHRPTLILSHNKTLAAQLYGEFKSFFPENAVEYFVSYYVVPEFDPVSYAVVSFYGRKNIHGFPFGPETTPFEFDFVVCI